MGGGVASRRGNEQRRSGAVREEPGKTPALHDSTDYRAGGVAEWQVVHAVNVQILRNTVGAQRPVDAVLRPGLAGGDHAGRNGKTAALRACVVDVFRVGVIDSQVKPLGHALAGRYLERVI